MRHSKSKRKICVASTTAERRPSKQTSNKENGPVPLTQASHYNPHTKQTYVDQPSERKFFVGATAFELTLRQVLVSLAHV